MYNSKQKESTDFLYVCNVMCKLMLTHACFIRLTGLYACLTQFRKSDTHLGYFIQLILLILLIKARLVNESLRCLRKSHE